MYAHVYNMYKSGPCGRGFPGNSQSMRIKFRGGRAACMATAGEGGCLAEELADARLPSRTEVLAILESLTLAFLQAVARGEDPELHLVRSAAVSVEISCSQTKCIRSLYCTSKYIIIP